MRSSDESSLLPRKPDKEHQAVWQGCPRINILDDLEHRQSVLELSIYNSTLGVFVNQK